MIHIIFAILFSISANIDNLAIGISYGIKKLHIYNYQKIIITLFTSLATLISMIIGNILANSLNLNIANNIGSMCLIIIGIYSLFSNTKDTNSNNKTCTNILLMTFIMSTNNIFTGFMASSAGINIIATFLSTILFCYLFLDFGLKLGNNIKNKRIEKYSNFLSSIILIILGIVEFFIK